MLESWAQALVQGEAIGSALAEFERGKLVQPICSVVAEFLDIYMRKEYVKKKKSMGPSWMANMQSGKRQNPKHSKGLDCETLKGHAKEIYSEENNGLYF